MASGFHGLESLTVNSEEHTMGEFGLIVEAVRCGACASWFEVLPQTSHNPGSFVECLEVNFLLLANFRLRLGSRCPKFKHVVLDLQLDVD